MLSNKKTNKCKIEVWTPIPQQRSLPGKINTTKSNMKMCSDVKYFWTINTESGGKQIKDHTGDSGLVSGSMECIIFLISQELLPRGNRTIVPNHCKASTVASSNTSFPILCALFWLEQAGIAGFLLTHIKNHLQTIPTILFFLFFFFFCLFYS